MNHKELNDLLLPEYNSYFKELLSLFDNESKDTLSLPLLMNVYAEYDVLRKKIMVVGQETKNWYSKLSNSDENVQTILEHYMEFELGKKYYNSPFWRFNKRFFKTLNPANKSNGLLWTNLSKIDQNGKGVNQDVRNKNKAGYDLLLKEIQITKPEIIIFLTSWKEDKTLKNIFTGLSFQKFEGVPFEYLVRLKSSSLPYNTFRTYHPRFLNDSSRSKYTINEMTDKIVDCCVR